MKKQFAFVSFVFLIHVASPLSACDRSSFRSVCFYNPAFTNNDFSSFSEKISLHHNKKGSLLIADHAQFLTVSQLPTYVECTWFLDLSAFDSSFGQQHFAVKLDFHTDDGNNQNSNSQKPRPKSRTSSDVSCLHAANSTYYIEIWYPSNGSPNNDDQLGAVFCGGGDDDVVPTTSFEGAPRRSLTVRVKLLTKEAHHFRAHFSLLTTPTMKSAFRHRRKPKGQSLIMKTTGDCDFSCLVNGRLSCVPAENRCDSVTHCDNAEDEAECVEEVSEELTDKNRQDAAELTLLAAVMGDRSLPTAIDSGCGSPRYQIGKSGNFHSAGYPCGYTAYLQCLWYIHTPPDTKILLSFNHIFSIGEADDSNCLSERLSVFSFDENNNAKLVRKFCGNRRPKTALVRTNKIVLALGASSTPSTDTPGGFRLSWAAVDDAFIKSHVDVNTKDRNHRQTKAPPPIADAEEACSNSDGLTLTALRGIIQTPSFNDAFYPSSLTCKWTLKPAVALKPNHHWTVNLFFTYFQVGPEESSEAAGSCKTGDRVEVFTIDLDENRRRGFYCNAGPPKLDESLDVETKHPLTIEFFSDDDATENYGFELSYQLRATPNSRAKAMTPKRFAPKTTALSWPQCGISPKATSDARSYFRSSSSETTAEPAAVPLAEPEMIIEADEAERIVGGIPAARGSWPWIVQLKYNNQHYCAATIIHPSWLLTAAHCFKGRRMASRWQGIAGRHFLFSEMAWDNRSPLIYLPIGGIFLHKSFGKTNYSKEFDIALIRLKQPIQFSRLAAPVCLPTRNTKINDFCFVAGWGDTKGTGGEGILKQVRLPIVDVEACRHSSLQYYASVTDSMVCGGYEEGGGDSCQGDSGGPLVCLVDKRWQLHGVVSFGVDCGKPNTPGVYTRVHSYLNWIRQVINAYP